MVSDRGFAGLTHRAYQTLFARFFYLTQWGFAPVLPAVHLLTGVPGIYLLLALHSRAILTPTYTEWVSGLEVVLEFAQRIFA